MSHGLSHPAMTQAEFFAWEPPDDRRYEVDGFAPVGNDRRHQQLRYGQVHRPADLAGVPILKRDQDAPGKYAWVLDPDGTKVEFWQPV